MAERRQGIAYKSGVSGKEVLESQILPQVPAGRLAQPAEIAALAAFICGDAATFMTGSNIALNGGQHMC